VIIAIIGILSSVVLASLNSARKKARDARRITDIQQYRTALEFYFDDFGAYPLDSAGGPLPALGAQYIAETPEDPLGNPVNPYKYISNAEGTAYCAGADLEVEAYALNTCNTVDIGAAYDFKVGP
jgi:type II secretory pathway pseudopilin PulG